jgi:hypothetical protein
MLYQSHVYLIPHTKFNREIKLNRKDIFHRFSALDVTFIHVHRHMKTFWTERSAVKVA